MELKETRTQMKRRVRDERIKALWLETYVPGSKNKILVAEQIMEVVDTSLTTVLRVVKPLC